MLRKGAGMRLERLARDLASNEFAEDKAIDFGAAGLYLPAAQTIFATTLSACVSVLACWLVPVGAISAIRTLALTLASGLLVIRRPIRIGQTRGVNTIFSALRPCCVIYVICLVLEQLIHTCISEESTYEHGFWRRVVYNASMTVMTLSAFLQSKAPRSESDVPFLISAVSLLVVAILPPPALALSGPLCAPPTLSAAAERVLRAFLFACVYVVLVYSAAPISNNLPDTLVCIARSTSSSAWVLGAIAYSLPLALFQICVVLYCSFVPSQVQYDAINPTRTEDIESLVGNRLPAVSIDGLPITSPISALDTLRCATPVDDVELSHVVSIIKNSGKKSFNPQSVVGSLSFDLSGVGLPNTTTSSVSATELKDY